MAALATAQRGYNYFQIKSSFYAEGASRGSPYTINYDRIFRYGDILSYSYRVGLAYARSRASLPFGMNVFTSEGRHHTEFCALIVPSVQTTYKNIKPTDAAGHFIGTLGYRYQNMEFPGLFLRAGLGLMFIADPPITSVRRLLHPYGYASISLGYTLK